MSGQPLWKAYEQQIAESLREAAGADAEVTFDDRGRQRLPGRFSKIDRQIDVIVKGRFAGLSSPHTMIVDCKLINHRLDVTHVEAFAGLLDDVGVSVGLLVSSDGFSPAAQRRAEAVRGLELDVVQLDDLAKWRPRKPAIATTSGTSQATLTYLDTRGEVHTESVNPHLAQQLISDQTKPLKG